MLKTQLDKYILEYETKDFIKDDPVQFVHRFKTKQDKLYKSDFDNFLNEMKMIENGSDNNGK